MQQDHDLKETEIKFGSIEELQIKMFLKILLN
jgi:hypothetical protein